MTRKILIAVAAPTALAAALAASVLSTAGPANAAPLRTVAYRAASAPSAANAFTFAWPVLRAGSRGEAVVALQYLLTARGFSTGGVDGIFGPRTRVELIRFQKAHKLSADGVAGAQTWPALIVRIVPGSTGDAVRALQSALNAYFGARLAVDGVYGKQTLAAVHGIEGKYDLGGALGTIDPATWNALVSHGG